MGTSYYLLEKYRAEEKRAESDGGYPDFDSPYIHIGKISAAGKYCWDCMVSLFDGGESWIHGPPAIARSDLRSLAIEQWKAMGWHEQCPECLKKPGDDNANIRGCSSFSFAQSPVRINMILNKAGSEPAVIDEYGKEYTGVQMLDILLTCPIQFTDLIGRWFS